MRRIAILTAVILACAFATIAQASVPHLSPFPGIAVADQTAQPPQLAARTSVSAAFFSDPVAAALAIGNRLVTLQSDVTEDNAGNGNPDSPVDGNDGGWDWESTGQAYHASDGSYENLYGPIAAGLAEAAIFTGDARLATGIGDVFAGISQPGVGLLGTAYYRIWDGGIAPAYVRWADHAGNAALKDTIKTRHDKELLLRGGAGGRSRTVCLGRRSQGLAGMWPWDIVGLAQDSKALAGAFTAVAATYEAEVDSIAQVIMDDMNDLLGTGGWEPTDFAQSYHQMGLMGAMEVFDLSPRSDDDALAATLRDSLVNGQQPDGSWGVSYAGVFYPQDVQTTAYMVMGLMRYGLRHDDAAAIHAAGVGQQWLLNAVSETGLVDLGGGAEYPEVSAEVASALLLGDAVTPVPPATCITPAYACVQVPVTVDRVDTTPVRGFTVDIQLAGGLALCAPGIVEGTYLSSVGGTAFEVVDNGGGSYTVDCAILGGSVGAVGAGTLFTINLAGSGTGIGTVTVTSVEMRDLVNLSVPAVPGAPAEITIDNSAPAAPTALAAAQVKTGNDGDGTTKIEVSWPAVEAGATVHVYRADYGYYPEYDDLGGAVPAAPVVYPPVAPWAHAADVTSGTTLLDEVAWPNRGFWYYVAYVEDACGNVSAISNMTGGTLNYHLGDVYAAADCEGNNVVGLQDISLLGNHYGVTSTNPLYLACLDVGPTTNRYVDARPTTDNKVNFEDLMMFAINFGTVSLTTTPVAAVASDAVWLEAPVKVVAGQTFTASLRLSGSGTLLGLSAQLGWDRAIAELVSVEPGELATSQGGLVLHGGGGLVDCALLGADRRLAGDGELARVTFRALASGSPQLVLGTVDGRDAWNRTMELTGTPPAVVPAVTSFAPAMPNPFRGTTTLSYALAKGGAVELAVYGVDGRKVATLASGEQEAGSYRLVWDGGGLRPGLYYARLTTPEGKFTRTLVLVK